MNLTVEEKKLQKIIKKAVSDALEEKIEKLRIGLIPYVSEKEMAEIKRIFGSPDKYKSEEFKEEFKRVDL